MILEFFKKITAEISEWTPIEILGGNPEEFLENIIELLKEFHVNSLKRFLILSAVLGGIYEEIVWGSFRAKLEWFLKPY